MDGLVRTEDPTTLALVELDDHGSARYRFYDEGTAAPGLTVDDARAALPDGVAYLHVGTLGLVLEPMATALEALAGELAGRALVMTDPNCRPEIIGDAAAYRARLARVLAVTDVAKVSDDDLAWLEPGVDPTEAARGLLAQGPAVVLLTRGADGALVLTGDAEHAVAAPPVDVVDTIGAGDAFSGGWLAWWSERGLGREDLADAARVTEATRFACLVAALTCARAGATPPTRAELETDPNLKRDCPSLGSGDGSHRLSNLYAGNLARMDSADRLRTLLDGPDAEIREHRAGVALPAGQRARSSTSRARSTARRCSPGRRSWPRRAGRRSGYPVEYGGEGDVGRSIAAFETLAFGDLSLLVKCGVQFGLFGGAVLHLGTATAPRALPAGDRAAGAARLLRDDRDRRTAPTCRRSARPRPTTTTRASSSSTRPTPTRARTTSATPRATAAWPPCSRS